MPRTDRVTDALSGRIEAVGHVSTADALLGVGTANAATAHVPAPLGATTVQATTTRATLGAAAQRVVKDAVADANGRNGAPDQEVAMHRPAARRIDMDRRPGLQRTGASRAQPARPGLASISRQRVRPRPELRRPRP
jgi:hypothetical protein